jgi:hypothetical protein
MSEDNSQLSKEDRVETGIPKIAIGFAVGFIGAAAIFRYGGNKEQLLWIPAGNLRRDLEAGKHIFTDGEGIEFYVQKVFTK